MPYKNKADRNARHKERMATDPTYHIRHNVESKAWADANPEKAKEGKRCWVKENPDKNKDSKRSWRNSKEGKVYKENWDKENRDKLRASYHKYRARKAGNGGSFTAEQFTFLCRFYKYKCLCCNKKKPLEADHVIPVSKGGSSNISNIQPLCRSCNAKKSTKTTDYRKQPEGPAMLRGRN